MKRLTIRQYADLKGLTYHAIYKQIQLNKLPEGVSFQKIGSTYIISMRNKKVESNIRNSEVAIKP